MKRTFLFLMVALAFVACQQEEPVAPELIPTADFSYSVDNLKVYFTNKSSNANSFSWDFGDGTTSTEKNPRKTYKYEGTYVVTLTVTNVTLKNSTSKSIKVKIDAPTAKFSYETQHPLKVKLSNVSSNATSYEWDFGDGVSSTENSPTHKYTSKGVYRVRLTAKNSSGSDTYESNVTIVEPTKCYLSGYVISKIPQQNEYYQIRFTDQYTISPDNFGTTSWTLLSDANLPKTFTFSSPEQITGFNKYWCTLWQSSKSNGSNATNVFRCNITKEQLFTSYPEVLTNNDKTKTIIEMHFLWK